MNTVIDQVDIYLSQFDFITKYCIVSTLFKKYLKKMPKFDEKYVISKLTTQNPILNNSQINYLKKVNISEFNLTQIVNRCDPNLIECFDKYPHWGIITNIEPQVPITHFIRVYQNNPKKTNDFRERYKIVEKDLLKLGKFINIINNILDHYKIPYYYKKSIILYYLKN